MNRRNFLGVLLGWSAAWAAWFTWRRPEPVPPVVPPRGPRARTPEMVAPVEYEMARSATTSSAGLAIEVDAEVLAEIQAWQEIDCANERIRSAMVEAWASRNNREWSA